MTPSRNKLLSEPMKIQAKDYKYFARLFGTNDTQNLLRDFDEDIK